MKIGVIGLGYWGKKVAREYRDLMNEGMIDELILHDANNELSRKFRKEECENCRVEDNYKNLMNLDGVHICTPNSTHYDLSMDFLRNDVNVMVEKPMTIRYQRAKKLAYYAYNKDLVLAVGHIFRFNNAVRKVKEMYEDGFLGKPYFARLKWTNIMEPPSERDVVYDLAPHPLDILNFIFSNWPTRVSAIGRAFRREKLEEVAYINAEFNSNFIAHMEVSWLFPKKVRNVSIMFDKRFVSLDAVIQKIKIYNVGKEEWKEIDVEKNNTIRDEAIHFINAIKNKTTPINDGFNASENVKVLESCVKAIRENKIVEIVW